MLFNSIQFVLFLPLIVIFYFLIPHKYRWILLLIASYFFYMCWKVEYVFLIILSTIVDYFCAIAMEKKINKKEKRPYLILSLFVNLGLLFIFKYLNFGLENINIVFQKLNISFHIPLMKILLPIGISFYTFQTLSYTIDVFFGRQKAEKHLGYFALYVSFFPQLVAGPIERFSRLSPQLKANHHFSYTNLVKGLRLIIYGLFIKMVIADNLGQFVDKIYENPNNFSAIDILKGIFFYSFQIYSDFYGYSIIAIGSALILGIKIMDNFKTPYLSKNISEFWQRWHISLSSWFRDYLYYPLGGNRVKKQRWIINIMIVFIISGIWHGANWTFLIWGTLFGLFYIIEKQFNSALKIKETNSSFSVKHILLAIKTFTLVSLFWVFFRSQTFGEAINILKLLFVNTNNITEHLTIPNYLWICFSLFLISDIILYNKRFDTWIDKQNFILKWLIYSFLIFSIIVFSNVDETPFIYFQF